VGLVGVGRERSGVGICFREARPDDLDHDGGEEGKEEAGHLWMSGPHDLAETEYPGTETDGGSN
jgi:hypothetical protein